MSNYGEQLVKIADTIENMRVTIYQTVDLEEDKQAISDGLFTLQSRLYNYGKHIAAYEEC